MIFKTKRLILRIVLFGALVACVAYVTYPLYHRTAYTYEPIGSNVQEQYDGSFDTKNGKP